MKKHIQIVGILHLIFAFLEFISTFSLMTDTFFIANSENTTKVLTVVFIFLSILTFLGSIGLLMYKGWARYLILLLSFISLLAFPIGTIVGGYSIWVLFKKEAIALFIPENDISGNNDYLG